MNDVGLRHDKNRDPIGIASIFIKHIFQQLVSNLFFIHRKMDSFVATVIYLRRQNHHSHLFRNLNRCRHGNLVVILGDKTTWRPNNIFITFTRYPNIANNGSDRCTQDFLHNIHVGNNRTSFNGNKASSVTVNNIKNLFVPFMNMTYHTNDFRQSISTIVKAASGLRLVSQIFPYKFVGFRTYTLTSTDARTDIHFTGEDLGIFSTIK